MLGSKVARLYHKFSKGAGRQGNKEAARCQETMLPLPHCAACMLRVNPYRRGQHLGTCSQCEPCHAAIQNLGSPHSAGWDYPVLVRRCNREMLLNVIAPKVMFYSSFVHYAVLLQAIVLGFFLILLHFEARCYKLLNLGGCFPEPS